ncbi:hypothetical protein J4731_08005 [Providencia rettgeri]|nr:hypothetical protein [Providencia rettgeri]
MPWVLGMPELIYPMMAGAFVAIIIDGTILYGLFNTRAYPASASWPAGVATAETLWAGNKGGKRLGALLTGFAAGAIGAGLVSQWHPQDRVDWQYFRVIHVCCWTSHSRFF